MGEKVTVREFRCKSCGASLQFDPRTLSVRCNYCGAAHVIDPAENTESEIEVPDLIVPFHVDHKEFAARVIDYLARGFFTRDDVVREARHEGFVGVYVPFYSFSFEYKVHFEADVGYKFEVGSGTDKKTLVRWQPHNGDITGSISQGEIVTLASALLLRQHREHMGFFASADPTAASPRRFAPEYLLGFACEPFNISSDAAWQEAGQHIAAAKIRERVVSLLPGDLNRNVRIHVADSRTSSVRLYYPFWIETYVYRDKPYRVFVDGHNGRVGGARPLSTAKATLVPGLGIASLFSLVAGIVARQPQSGSSGIGLPFLFCAVIPALVLVGWFVVDAVLRSRLRRGGVDSQAQLMTEQQKRISIAGAGALAAACVLVPAILLARAASNKADDEAERNALPAMAPMPDWDPNSIGDAEHPRESASTKPAAGPRTVSVQVRVDPTKPDGRAWDATSDPDISGTMKIAGLSREIPKCQDAFSCEASFTDVVMAPGAEIEFQLMERDVASDDDIGTGSFSWSGEPEVTRRVGAATVTVSFSTASASPPTAEPATGGSQVAVADAGGAGGAAASDASAIGMAATSDGSAGDVTLSAFDEFVVDLPSVDVLLAGKTVNWEYGDQFEQRDAQAAQREIRGKLAVLDADYTFGRYDFRRGTVQINVEFPISVSAGDIEGVVTRMPTVRHVRDYDAMILAGDSEVVPYTATIATAKVSEVCARGYEDRDNYDSYSSTGGSVTLIVKITGFQKDTFPLTSPGDTEPFDYGAGMFVLASIVGYSIDLPVGCEDAEGNSLVERLPPANRAR